MKHACGVEVKVTARSIIAGLAIGLMFAPGCGQGEPTASSPQPDQSPVPRADQGLTVEPKFPRPEQGGASKEISDAEKDLRKDLGGSPVIRPDVPTTTTKVPPAGKAGTP